MMYRQDFSCNSLRLSQREHLVLNMRTWCLFICAVIFADCIRAWILKSLKAWWTALRGRGDEYQVEAQPWETRERAFRTIEDLEAINRRLSDTIASYNEGEQEVSSKES